MISARPRVLVAGGVALALVALVPALAEDSRLPVPVLLEDRPLMLPPNTTVGTLVTFLRITPEPGDLLDVDGLVLRRGVHPGRIEVNGSRGRAARVLVPGDVIDVVEGRDRVERLARDVVPVPEGGIPNPQSHVGTVPGVQIIRVGSISGKVVSSEFRPSGDARPPRAVALTFDDGPSPRYTRRIARTLRRFGVPATFFVIGYLAERYPDLIRLLRERGFEIGNHSMHHPMDRPFESLHPGQIRAQIEGCDAVLTEMGIAAEAFRPPGGSWSSETVELAIERGERTVLWSVDSEDFRPQKPRLLAARVVREAKPGSIILMHDGGGNRSATVRALPRIINGLRRKGLEIVSLS